MRKKPYNANDVAQNEEPPSGRPKLNLTTNNNQEKTIDNTEYKIAVVGEITMTLLSTINTPAL